jgi:hypothetical protein
VHYKKTISILILSIFCYIAIPYPACYYFDSREDMGPATIYKFKKNDFYGISDCEEIKRKLVDVDKDVTVMWEDKEVATYKVQEVCPEN